MLRVAVCDHDSGALAHIRSQIEHSSNAEIAGAFQQGEAFLEELHECRPDVLLLDLELPESEGFGVVDALVSRDWTAFDQPPLLILTTLDPSFGIACFDCGAIGILNKPVRSTELDRCLKRSEWALRQLEPRQRLHQLNTKLDEVQALYRRAVQTSHIVAREGLKITNVPIASIDWIEFASTGHVLLHCGPTSWRKHANLRDMAEETACFGFLQINRGIVINTRAVTELEGDGFGLKAVRLHSGQRLKISRPYRPAAQIMKTDRADFAPYGRGGDRPEETRG